MSKKKTIHKRRWLEPKNSDTMSYVAYTMNGYDSGGLSVDLADCNRQINLYFEAGPKGQRKLDKLVAFLQEAKEVRDANQGD